MIPFLNPCVRVNGWALLCGRVHKHVSAHVCTGMWRPKVHTEYSSSALHILPSETESLIGLGLRRGVNIRQSSTDLPTAPRGPRFLPYQGQDYKCVPPHQPFSHGFLEPNSGYCLARSLHAIPWHVLPISVCEDSTNDEKKSCPPRGGREGTTVGESVLREIWPCCFLITVVGTWISTSMKFSTRQKSTRRNKWLVWATRCLPFAW